MTTKLKRATISDLRTSNRRLVKCPGCKYPFFTHKDKTQCSKCGLRFK